MYNAYHHIQQYKRNSGRWANYKFVTGEATKIPQNYKKATIYRFYLLYFSEIYML